MNKLLLIALALASTVALAEGPKESAVAPKAPEAVVAKETATADPKSAKADKSAAPKAKTHKASKHHKVPTTKPANLPADKPADVKPTDKPTGK